MESDRAMLWTVAVAASLGLHVLVIVLFIGFGALSGAGDAPALVVKPQPALADVAAAKESAAAHGDATPSQSAETGGRASFSPTDQPTDASSNGPRAVSAGDRYYTVKPGDNLSKIAKLDGSSLAELAELNGKSIKELSRLMVGQKIKVKNGVEQ